MQYSKEKYSLWATAQSETKFEITVKRGKDRENATIRKTVKHKWLIKSQGEFDLWKQIAEYRDIVSLSNKIS